MKKNNKKKLLLTIASIGIVVAPITTVLSCGTTTATLGNKPNKKHKFIPENDGSKYFPYINDVAKGEQGNKNKIFIPQSTNSFSAESFLHKGSEWYDAGFSWYEFLSRPWYTAPSVAAQTTVIDNVVKAQNMVNVGFITAYNKAEAEAKEQAEPNNWYVKLAVDEANANSGWTIPTIAGTLSPIILTNAENWNFAKRISLLNEIRKANGNFKLSFGGWNNYSLASKITLNGGDEATQVNQLYTLYKNLIDATRSTHIDFDVEGLENGRADDLGNKPLTPKQGEHAKKIRLQALEKIRKEYPDINITFTIPTNMSSLGGITTYTNAQMIQDLLKYKIINAVNLMAFDYGKNDFDVSNSPRLTTPGEAALYSISSANTLHQLFVNNGINDKKAWDMVHITMMNGRSDIRYQVNWLTDAQILADWAIKKNIGELSAWSLQRDMGQFARDDYSKQINNDYGPGYTDKDHIYTQPLTIDQLMNYKQTGTKITINIGGVDWNINAALTDSLGTKDFAYAKIINNFTTKTVMKPDDQVFNADFFNTASINSFDDIINFTGVMNKNIDYTVPTLATYNSYLTKERKLPGYFH